MRAEIDLLLDIVYAIPEDPSATGELLRQVMRVTDASMGHLFTQDQRTGYVRVDTAAPPEWVQSYMETYGAHNPVEARMLPHVRTGLTCRLHDFFTPREYESLPIYERHFKQLEMFWGIGTHVEVTPSRQTVLTINRGRKQTDFSRQQLAMLSTLSPHLRRAVRVGQALNEAKSEVAALRSGLDQFRIAVAELDRSLRVWASNEPMQQWLANDAAATLTEGRLRLSDAQAETALTRAATQLTSRCALPHPVPVVVMLGTGTSTNQLVCVAKPTSMGTAGRFLVFVRPESPDADSRQRLLAHFQLTRAQADLLAALVAGESPREYGARRGLSPNTVKSHLAEVFRKTETRRQAELLLLVGRLG
jgi:DNA-binding CsgD family transcriptional regulator